MHEEMPVPEVQPVPAEPLPEKKLPVDVFELEVDALIDEQVEKDERRKQHPPLPN